MGREIRRVPPNWEHPKGDGSDGYQSMYDRDYETATKEWKEGYALWESGKHPSRHIWEADDEYWDYEGTPDKSMHRPKFTEEPTWFQVYQTVSEGTPVTPPFATKKELVDYLVENGDFWDQSRGHGGWERVNAEKFVGCGWAPSAMVIVGEGMKTPRDGI